MKRPVDVLTASVLLLALAHAAPGPVPDPPRVLSLTSFGRPAETAPAPAPKQGSKGRECKTNSDCGPIPYTSCLADTRDGKTRCLCLDYTQPINGICNRKLRGLYEKCDTDSECLDGGECRPNGNATASLPKSTRICQCLPSRTPENGLCNGVGGGGQEAALVGAAAALLLLSSLRQHNHL